MRVKALTLICAAILFSGAAISSASAQTIGPVYYDQGGEAVFEIPVTASVGGMCGFAPDGNPSATQDVGELHNPYSYDFPFVLRCTVSSRMAIVSTNGGLLTSEPTATGYTALAPYDVTLHMEGASESIEDTCAAANLEVSSLAACSFRGTASTTVGLHLEDPSYDVTGSYVRISSPGYSGSDILVASDAYADTLTVTVSAAP